MTTDPLAIVRAAAQATGAGLWAKLRSGTAGNGDRRQVLLGLVDTSRTLFRGLGERLAAGAVAVEAWYRRFVGLLVPRQEAATRVLLGQGDRLELADPDRRAMEERQRKQLGFLAGFRQGLLAGAVAIDRRLVTRSELYGRAIWSVAEGTVRDRVKRLAPRGLAPGDALAWLVRSRGPITQERRWLAASNHCHDCPPLAAMGWQPLGTLPDIGDTECSSFCHCHFTFR